MNNWYGLLKTLMYGDPLRGQQMRSLLVFIIFYMVIMLPMMGQGTSVLSVLDRLLITQGLGVITVIIQMDPLFRQDMNDGFLERWLGNQGSSFTYYIVRHSLAFFSILMPILIVSLFFSPLTEAKHYGIFFILSLNNMKIAGLWSSCLALLLANHKDAAHSMIGMVFSALLLLPHLLIGQVILDQMLTNTIAMSSLGLYAGVSLMSIALNLSIAPTLIRFSVHH